MRIPESTSSWPSFVCKTEVALAETALPVVVIVSSVAVHAIQGCNAALVAGDWSVVVFTLIDVADWASKVIVV